MKADKGQNQATHGRAVAIAAQATGLRQDQVRRAVEEYRLAVASVEIEPEWRALMHMSGSGTGLHQYVADGTGVTLQIESWKKRGQWHQERYYVFSGNPYEHYAEARAVELAGSVRPKPYTVGTDNG